MDPKRVLIYGGKGALGQACVQYFKQKQWWVLNVDLFANDDAHSNILVEQSNDFKAQADKISHDVNSTLHDKKLDAILCVAGGWAGGSSSNPDFFKNADLMWKQSMWSSLIAANLASTHLTPGGFLQLTGAKAALEATPEMIGYGCAKAAVHHLTKSLADPKGGLPTDASVVAILPVCLDTPMNRKWMPQADFQTWTPLQFVAELLFKWASEQGEHRPKNGSLVQLITKDGHTVLVEA